MPNKCLLRLSPRYTDDGFIGAIQGFFPFIMVISFLYSVSAIVRALVHEKELRIKEAMKMIGLAGWVNWTAWFVKNFLFLMISISAIIIIFNVGGLMPATSVGVLLLFLVAYVIALIGYCFMMSTFFSSSTVAAISSWILFFALCEPPTHPPPPPTHSRRPTATIAAAPRHPHRYHTLNRRP